MWIFGPEGLTMPARIPEGGAEGTVDPKWLGPNGDFTLQVRGRVKSHLENIIRDYFEPLGLPYSDIQMTPEMDYNCRFYTTHEAMATVAYKQVMDIDFLKFKPQAERKGKDGKALYKDGAAYHSVLNSIWGTVCKLGSPGGVWGSYSSTNPNGYKDSKGKGKSIVPLNQKGASGQTYASALRGDDSYFDEMEDYPRGSLASRVGTGDYWWATAGDDDDLADIDDLDYTPGRTRFVDSIIESLDGIPEDQWSEHVPEHEFKLIEPFMGSNDSGGFSPVEVFQAAEFDSRSDRKSKRRSKSRKDSNGRRYFKKN